MNIENLITIIPDLLDLFLSGFIFMLIYNWISSRKVDTMSFVVGSIFISYLIKVICSLFLPPTISHSLVVLIYVVVAIISSLAISIFINTNSFKSILVTISYKTPNTFIFRDVLDFEEGTILCLYLKNSNIKILGQSSVMEENGIDSYLSLTNYSYYDNDDNEIKTFLDSERGMVVTSLKDIERIEILYPKESKVWDYHKPKG